jgi:hypothetical protein
MFLLLVSESSCRRIGEKRTSALPIVASIGREVILALSCVF